jgi:hypothetical protein
MPILSSSGRMRRRILVLALPVCLSLLFAGLPTSALAQQGWAINHLKAPELDGAVGQLGSDRPIKLKEMRGKIVILEFWTLC